VGQQMLDIIIVFYQTKKFGENMMTHVSHSLEHLALKMNVMVELLLLKSGDQVQVVTLMF
jgi:hypothetical protein